MKTDRHTLAYDGDRHKGRRFGTLWQQRGSGDVTLAIYFDELHVVERLDLLQDSIGLLTREYESLLSGPPASTRPNEIGIIHATGSNHD